MLGLITYPTDFRMPQSWAIRAAKVLEGPFCELLYKPGWRESGLSKHEWLPRVEPGCQSASPAHPQLDPEQKKPLQGSFLTDTGLMRHCSSRRVSARTG